jgi:hypothetical protein
MRCMHLVAAITISILLAACAVSPHGDAAGSRSRVVYLASSKAPCSNGAMKTECYRIRENPGEPWQLWYAPIDNFTYQPGTEYLLKVTETHVTHAPADASALRWRVDKIVEQHPVP